MYMPCDMTAQRLHLQKDYTNQETVSGPALKIQIKLTFISGNHIIFNLIISLESYGTATSGS